MAARPDSRDTAHRSTSHSLIRSSPRQSPLGGPRNKARPVRNDSGMTTGANDTPGRNYPKRVSETGAAPRSRPFLGRFLTRREWDMPVRVSTREQNVALGRCGQGGDQPSPAGDDVGPVGVAGRRRGDLRVTGRRRRLGRDRPSEHVGCLPDQPHDDPVEVCGNCPASRSADGIAIAARKPGPLRRATQSAA
jgi:hypothetical protein